MCLLQPKFNKIKFCVELKFNLLFVLISFRPIEIGQENSLESSHAERVNENFEKLMHYKKLDKRPMIWSVAVYLVAVVVVGTLNIIDFVTNLSEIFRNSFSNEKIYKLFE